MKTLKQGHGLLCHSVVMKEGRGDHCRRMKRMGANEVWNFLGDAVVVVAAAVIVSAAADN
jgi:hypothetical protein